MFSFHYCHSTALLLLRSESYFVANTATGPPIPSVFFRNLIFPLLLLEQFDLNAEAQLSQSRSCCRLCIRSRPFRFFIFRQGEEVESPQFLGWIALPGHFGFRAPSNGRREGGREHGRLWRNRLSRDQGPDGGHHSHSLHADDSQKGYLLAYPQLHISVKQAEMEHRESFTSCSCVQTRGFAERLRRMKSLLERRREPTARVARCRQRRLVWMWSSGFVCFLLILDDVISRQSSSFALK